MKPCFRWDREIALTCESGSRRSGSAASQSADRCALPSTGERSDDRPHSGSASGTLCGSHASALTHFLKRRRRNRVAPPIHGQGIERENEHGATLDVSGRLRLRNGSGRLGSRGQDFVAIRADRLG